MGAGRAICFDRDYSRGFLLRNSGLASTNVLVTVDTWHRIADLMWQKKTFPQACEELGLNERVVERKMTTDIKSYLVDVSMLAGARDEYLGER